MALFPHIRTQPRPASSLIVVWKDDNAACICKASLSTLRYSMIKSFRHKGLEAFFRRGTKAGIQAQHAAKLRLQLTALNAATKPGDLAAPGWRLHPLTGDLRGYYSITVNGNWRVVFRFVGTDVDLVDYLDYH